MQQMFGETVDGFDARLQFYLIYMNIQSTALNCMRSSCSYMHSCIVRSADGPVNKRKAG